MGEFERGWNVADTGNYCKDLVEFCSGKVLSEICKNVEEEINNGEFSRLTYDMMLAWEKPSYYDDDDPAVRIKTLIMLIYYFGATWVIKCVFRSTLISISRIDSGQN